MKISVLQTSVVNGERTDFEYIGTLSEKDEKYLLRYVDENNIKTSIKLNDGVVFILRSGDSVNHRFSVVENEKTSGAIGENAFSVLGKKCSWQFNGDSGEVHLNYVLPDISSEPMIFNLRIKFNII